MGIFSKSVKLDTPSDYFQGHVTLTKRSKFEKMTSNRFRAFLNSLFILNFSLGSIWKELKNLISPSFETHPCP